jgi:acyl-CoA synthetase (AMP-forming)/AMP-acid ligase II
LIELLRAAAQSDPDQPAVICDDRVTSYGELVRAAESAASVLRDRGIDRFGIVEHDAAVVLALLAGASLAGAEACVYPPLQAPDDARELATRFEHEWLVSGLGDPLGPITERPGDPVRPIRTLTPAELTDGSAGPAPAAPAQPRPLLILTTGTTGTPRGVRHDWTRVLRSAAHIRPSPDQRWLLAYGLAQFAGLQVLVHVAAARATLVAPTPRRPREGLAAMRRHGVNSASATPTFWRFLLAELRSDGAARPELRQITLGGEAVPEHVLADLKTTFPHARVSQIYAASESGSLPAVRDARAGLPIDLLEAGADANIAFRVSDGQLWVRSRVGMLGYFGEPPIDPDAWRPTGDLVEVHDSRIVFRGRTSDIINVGGVKVHPLPIEGRIGAVPGVALARVYGRPNALTGAIVAAEIVPEPGADTSALDDAIRESCADLPAAARPRSIRFVDSVPITGHKLGRASGDAR